MKWDADRLRKERLAKLQAQMQKLDIGALVLNNPINIRYATSVSVMPLWTSVNLARYAIIPPSGDPKLFEYGKALFRAKAVWPKSEAAKTWQFRFSQHTAVEAATHWATDVKTLMQEWGTTGSKVGIDIVDHYGYQALQGLGLTICDADEPLEEAKKIKTADEIVLLEQSCQVADAALLTLEQAIRPGISENELMGVFWGKMLALGGEHCSTRLLVSGDKTNPWFHESGERRVETGDLVGIDTDMIGPEGYLCDISRTFLCGDKANADQIEAFQIAHDFIQRTIDLCRLGTTYDEILEKVPRSRPEYVEQAYSCMIHGSGLDDEPPFFPYPEQNGLRPRGHLEENMVLSVEYYAGKKGKRDGVKLEEQILVTKGGPRLLAHYPFEEKLSGK